MSGGFKVSGSGLGGWWTREACITVHVAPFPSVILLVVLSAGCGPVEPRIDTLAIRAFSIDVDEDCRVDGEAKITLQALGSFMPTNRTAVQMAISSTGESLTFPPDTRGIEATADAGDRSWIGYSQVRTDSGIDVLLWDPTRSCVLVPGDEYRYPGGNWGQAIGYSASLGKVLLVGEDDEIGNFSQQALALDVNTGQLHGGSRLNLREPRAFSSVTEFGGGLLVAGGEDPLLAHKPLSTAEVYDGERNAFDDVPLALIWPRSRHAAVPSLDGDQTFLIGGMTEDGSLLRQVEAVSARTSRSSIAGLFPLGTGRLFPSALRLLDGRVLVGGGLDDAGDPVETVEWFSADMKEIVAQAILPASYERRFVALPGGGALSVSGCRPASMQSSTCLEMCDQGRGCPIQIASSFDLAGPATWIAPDGSMTTVQIDVPEQGDEMDFAHPELIEGSGGAPWLLAGARTSVQAEAKQYLWRFDPWAVRFRLVNDDGDVAPRLRGRSLISVGADTFVWLTDGEMPDLMGRRMGVRGAWAHDQFALIPRFDPSQAVPLAPSRPLRENEIFDPNARLFLPADSDLTVFVTDTLYEDVVVTIGFRDVPPTLLLGSFVVGGLECPWPEGEKPTVVVRRNGSLVELVRDETKQCHMVSEQQVTIGLQGGADDSEILRLEVTRGLN